MPLFLLGGEGFGGDGDGGGGTSFLSHHGGYGGGTGGIGGVLGGMWILPDMLNVDLRSKDPHEWLTNTRAASPCSRAVLVP